MKFIGVRELKESFISYLNSGEEIVITKRKKPIARISPIKKNSPESALLEIGRILAESGITEKDAQKALSRLERNFMAKVVVDANVLISSVFGGLPLEAINLALSHHEVFYSEEIENEFNGVLQKLEVKLKNNQVQKLHENMSRFLSFCKKISVTENLSICRDRKDDRYLSLCKQVSADFLITGDKDLLTISKKLLQKNNLTSNIISPAEFVRQELLQGKPKF